MTNSEIQNISEKFRYELGFSNNAEPIRLKNLLSNLNIITVFKDLSNDFSGMAIKMRANQDQYYRFMLVNSNHTLGRQHFTICHELYHLYIQENFTFKICQTGLFEKKDKQEYYADLFASNLLIPKSGLFHQIPQSEIKKDHITLPTILRLEQYFSCSRSALLQRLRFFDIVSKEYVTQFEQNIKKSALLHGFNLALYEKGNHNLVIGDYGILAKKLFDAEKISENNYYNLLSDLGIDLSTLEKFTEENDDC